MKMIFAVDENWNIGYDGDMLFKISKDLQRFRRLTETNIIIMGRKTFESLPDQKALPNRINIVITRDATYKADEVAYVDDLKSQIYVNSKIASSKFVTFREGLCWLKMTMPFAMVLFFSIMFL